MLSKNSDDKEKVFCISCRSDQARKVRPLKARAGIWQCPKCDLYFQTPRLSTGCAYGENYYQTKNFFKRKLEKWLTLINQEIKIRRIKSFVPKGRILDLGTGSGSFANNLTKKGYRVYAVDPYLRVKTKSLPNVFLRHKSLKECRFPNNFFSAACCWQSIEHFVRLDENISEIKRVVRNKGFLFLTTPNSASFGWTFFGKHWSHFNPFCHWQWFNIKSLSLLLERNSFRMISSSPPLTEYPFDLVRSLGNKYGKLAMFVSLPLLSVFRFLLSFTPYREILETVYQKNDV